MEARKKQGLLIVSLDLQCSAGELSTTHQRNLRNVTFKLVRLFERYRIPATWAVNDPGDEISRSLVRDTSIEHEIAIHGKGVWPAAKPSRSNIANDLRRRVDRASENNISICSLVGVKIEDPNTDLLVKNHISVLRAPLAGSSRRWAAPQPVRFGIWNLPASCRFPGTKTWLSEITNQKFQRMVRTAAARQKTLHLVIDVGAILDSTSEHLKTLEGVVACAADYRVASGLHTATLQDSIACMTSRPVHQPSKSILRAA